MRLSPEVEKVVVRSEGEIKARFICQCLSGHLPTDLR